MSITFHPFKPEWEALVSEGKRAAFHRSRGQTFRRASCNFANGNAVALLGLLGLPAEPYGTVAPADLPAVARAIIRAKNTARALGSVSCPAVDLFRFRCPEVTPADTLRRLEALEAVVSYCSRKGLPLHWD